MFLLLLPSCGTHKKKLRRIIAFVTLSLSSFCLRSQMLELYWYSSAAGLRLQPINGEKTTWGQWGAQQVKTDLVVCLVVRALREEGESQPWSCPPTPTYMLRHLYPNNSNNNNKFKCDLNMGKWSILSLPTYQNFLSCIIYSLPTLKHLVSSINIFLTGIKIMCCAC